MHKAIALVAIWFRQRRVTKLQALIAALNEGPNPLNDNELWRKDLSFELFDTAGRAGDHHDLGADLKLDRHIAPCEVLFAEIDLRFELWFLVKSPL